MKTEIDDTPWDAEIARRTLAGEDEETVCGDDVVSRHLRGRVDQAVASGKAKTKTEAIRIVAKELGLKVRTVTIATATPDTEWEIEFIRRVRAGEDEETALAGVIEIFLDAANPVALVGAIQQGREIPTLTRRRILATFDKEATTNEPVPTVFEIEPFRQEGSIADGLRDFFWAAYDALVQGLDPGQEFWRMLAVWLRAGHPEHWTGTRLDVPVKVRLRFREKQRGRPPKPETPINHGSLAEFMAREIANGTRYKKAAFKVWEALKAQADAENWQGDLPTEETIFAAYKRRSK